MRIKNLLTAENVLHTISALLSVFLILYLITYVSDARERSECQTRVNEALISSVSASREAAAIEYQAMDDLLNGLLSPDPDPSRELLEEYQRQRGEATSLRVNNPLPNPVC